jgi:endonuclease/exonuclease/phosphatase (EEP) superfamily protein YafD
MIAWILLVTWTVFVALHGLLSGRTWLWVIPEMVPPIAFVAVPLVAAAFVLYAPGADRRWAAALVLALLGAGLPWNGITLPMAAGEAGCSSGGVAPVVVFVWNTEYWDQGEDAASFLHFLRSQAADVYLLQEYVYWEGEREVPAVGIAELAAAMPDHVVFAEGELVTVIRRRLVPRLMPGAPGTALRTDISVGRTTMALYNVHMPVQLDLNKSPFRAEFYHVLRDRAQQRKRAFQAVEELLREAPSRFVLGGDFNSSPAMRAMNRLRARHVDVMRSAGRAYLATWPARWHRLWRIDWVITSRQVTTEWARLIDPEGRSDHDGQLCALLP